MTLGIYREADSTTEYSQDGYFSNPFVVSLDGSLGSSIERKAYVRNKSVGTSYTGITVTPVGVGLVDGTNGFSWKLSAGSTKPTEEQWDSISNGNTISLGNISDTTTYEAFWIKVEVPSGAGVASYQSVVLTIDATAV